MGAGAGLYITIICFTVQLILLIACCVTSRGSAFRTRAFIEANDKYSSILLKINILPVVRIALHWRQRVRRPLLQEWMDQHSMRQVGVVVDSRCLEFRQCSLDVTRSRLSDLFLATSII